VSSLDSNGHHVIHVTRPVKVSAVRVDFRVSPRVSDGTTRLYVEQHGLRGGCVAIGVILTDEKRRELIAVLTAQEPAGEDRSKPTPAPRGGEA
jgi:hypothetical protein